MTFPKPEPAPRAHVHRGILTINVSMLSFVVGDVIVKFLGLSLPPNELVCLRSIVIVTALSIVMAIRRKPPALQNILAAPMAARCCFDTINMIAFTTAVIHMNMAEQYSISLTSPFFMTIFAALIFRDHVGPRQWTAIGIAFCGALLVIKPHVDALDWWALLSLVGALAAAARETVTRKVRRDASSIEINFYSSLFAAVATSLLGLTESWLVPTPAQSLLIAGQATGWLVGAILLVEACRIAPLYIVAAFRYTLLIWGGIASYIVFNNVPDFWSVIGAVLIVACGLYAFHSEMVPGRAITLHGVTN